MPIHPTDNDFGPSCQDDYEFELNIGVYSPVVEQLEAKLRNSSYNIFGKRFLHTDVLCDGNTIYFVLEYSYNKRFDEESFFCLWTTNADAKDNMEHDDCRIARGGDFADLCRKLEKENIKLESIPLDAWGENIPEEQCNKG